MRIAREGFRWFVINRRERSAATIMMRERSNEVREKKFLPAGMEISRRKHHSSATLTDDHTLFLLNQQREKRSKVEKRSLFAWLFGRR
jgi:hypothetical protein